MNKARRFLVLVAVMLTAGALPFSANAQAAAPPAAGSSARVVSIDDAKAKAALLQSVATAKTVADLAKEIADLRKSGGDSKRLARLESAYRELKASGGDKVKLAEAEAKAILLLKDSPEGLKAFADRNNGPSRDLSRSFKEVMAACKEGTRPVLKALDVNAPGIGSDRSAMVTCEELVAPRTPEKESEVIAAKGTADKGAIEAQGKSHAVEAAAGWVPPQPTDGMAEFAQALNGGPKMSSSSKLLIGTGATLAAATAGYFAAGMMSDANRADHNGKVALGIVLPIGAAITLWQALSK